MTFTVPVNEYNHLDPEGSIFAQAIGEHCATTITNGFAVAHYKQNSPHALWHGSLSNFISSIIFASGLGLPTAVGALMLIKDYQTMLARIDECEAAEVEDVMRLFVAAYMVADAEMAEDAEPIRLGRWKVITAGEWTMQQLGQQEWAFRQTLGFHTKIHPAAYSWAFHVLVEEHTTLCRVKFLKEERVKLLLERRMEEQECDIADQTGYRSSSTVRRPLRVINTSSNDSYSYDSDSSSSSSSTPATSGVFVVKTRSCCKHTSEPSLCFGDEALFSEARVVA